MTSVEFGAYPPRLSDADRERALQVLREGVAEGRVSQDTFMRRVDVILCAQREDELRAVLQDLPTRRPTAGWFVAVVAKASAWPRVLRRAWQAERLPELLLPPAGPYPLSIGRAAGSVLRLNHFTVSRAHAQLRARGDGWTLRDLGSTNGTWVNGSRVTASVSVRPGDEVRFGQMAFRLALPMAQPGPAPEPVPQTRVQAQVQPPAQAAQAPAQAQAAHAQAQAQAHAQAQAQMPAPGVFGAAGASPSQPPPAPKA